jgi:hypothetical protein
MTNTENLGAAERIIESLTTHVDHIWHNRPGTVIRDTSAGPGVRWEYSTKREKCLEHPDAAVQPEKVDGKLTGRLLCATCKQNVRGNGNWVVYVKSKVGKKSTETKLGVLRNGKVFNGSTEIGRYQEAGIFQEVATFVYSRVAQVWELDNEFAARWASYAFAEDHRDLKVVLAAFMLVQSRKGDPILDGGKVAFYDEDFRDVGEAMVLIPKGKKKDDNREIDPKMLLRIHTLLTVPGVAEVNRRLGFGNSARKPFLGRWTKAVEKWLLFREENPKMLEGAHKNGYKSTIVELCNRVGYKPQSTKFFEILGWRQKQSEDGRRTLAIGQDIRGSESWEGMTEEAICERIVKEKPNYKRITSLLPKEVGVTKSILLAAIEAKCLSDKDVAILAPTLELHGLIETKEVKESLERYAASAKDMRAANIALRVKSQSLKDNLNQAADTAVQKAVEEVMKGLRVYFMVDISGSMENAIIQAKVYIAKFLQAFPEDKLHVSVFNSSGREIKIPHRSGAGVENAFRGITASGGTDYGAGIRALQDYKPAIDEDVLFIFVGDEGQSGVNGLGAPVFTPAVRNSGLSPVAFGLVPVSSPRYARSDSVRKTAVDLGIPCFEISPTTFIDVYEIPRILRNLIASTPVGAATATRAASVRVTLVDKILKTDLLEKPAWAA